MSFARVGFKLDWQTRGGVVYWKLMKFAKDTIHGFKCLSIGNPGKVMTESMAWKKTKALGRKEYQQPVELIVKSKKKVRVKWNVWSPVSLKSQHLLLSYKIEYFNGKLSESHDWKTNTKDHSCSGMSSKEEVVERVTGQELAHLPHDAVFVKCPDVYLKPYCRKNKYLFPEALLKNT